MQEFDSPYFAAVDLGSNSFHMLVVRFSHDKIEIVDREKEMVQIARGLQKNGELNQEAQQRAFACLSRFSERLRTLPNAQVRAVGTKTLRAAHNSASFLKQAENTLGFPIQIISGYEEARLVYCGLANTVVNDTNQRLVIDIGGGSTEFVIGHNDQPTLLKSLGIGCVSYTERFHVHPGQVNVNNMERVYLSACAVLEEIRQNYLDVGWQITYGTSGTMKAIADLVKDTDGGAIITRESLLSLIEETINHGEIVSEDLPILRKHVLPAGLAILKAIFDQLDLNAIHVANATLKEGLIYDTIGRFSDHDSRVATIATLQAKYVIDTEQAARVADTAITLWKQIDGPDLPGVSRTKILSWAANLHEVGLSVSHSGYQHHGYYLLRHSDLAGFGRYEQYILANLVRSHRKKISLNRFDGINPATLEAFIPLLVCLRLATTLHRRRENIDNLPALSKQDKSFVLTFSDDWLAAHPLTRAGLEMENQYLSVLGLTLNIIET